MARSQKQTYLPGTEPVGDLDIPEIEESLFAWLAAKGDQRHAADTTKIRHTTLATHMAEHGLERYPYIDPQTGKKKHVVIKRDPKAATVNAPRKERREREEPGQEVEPKTKTEKDADTVEHRKVPRASVENEIDPFASTRRTMDHPDIGGLKKKGE